MRRTGKIDSAHSSRFMLTLDGTQLEKNFKKRYGKAYTSGKDCGTGGSRTVPNLINTGIFDPEVSRDLDVYQVTCKRRKTCTSLMK